MIVYINGVKFKMLPNHVLLNPFRWLSKKMNILWRKSIALKTEVDDFDRFRLRITV